MGDEGVGCRGAGGAVEGKEVCGGAGREVRIQIQGGGEGRCEVRIQELGAREAAWGGGACVCVGGIQPTNRPT